MNVWFALHHEIHPQHLAARQWADSLDEQAVVYLCRFTQLGFLRLLTNTSAMRTEALTQSQAWKVFDALMAHPGNRMLEEPHGIDPLFRRFTDRKKASTKQWADGYLAAFAQAAGIKLVTFDKALASAVRGAVLLS